MDLAQAVVLITGATSGIGLALAERLMSAGSKVIACGRRKDRLDQIKADHPECETIVTDVATAEQRKRLFEESTKSFPNLNIVVNNAGIQRKVQLTEAEPWEATQSELAINLEAPIHLTQLFIPHLLKQKNPAIINVTSGMEVPFILLKWSAKYLLQKSIACCGCIDAFGTPNADLCKSLWAMQWVNQLDRHIKVWRSCSQSTP